MQATLERLRKRREELGDEGGFTLIELLIVIVILGILAAIVVFAVQNLTSSSALASCKADLKTAESATEAYKAQMGNYPDGGATPATATAAPAVTAAGQTDSGAITDNAALAAPTATVAGSPLLAGSWTKSVAGTPYGQDQNSNFTENIASPSGTPVGSWLKDVPVNGSHYAIFVSNDGKGTIRVDSVTSGADSGTAIAVANGSTVTGVCADVS